MAPPLPVASSLSLTGPRGVSCNATQGRHPYKPANFVLKYFWHDPSIQEVTSVPYSSWCRHRSKVFSPTCDFFPGSVTFVNAQSRVLTDKHRASSQRSSASSDRSFASATQPPPYTRVSPAVLNHGSLYPDQSARRASHRRGLRSPGPHSYHSSPPNMPDGTPIARSVISVPHRPQGSVMQHDTRETSLQARQRRGRSRYFDRSGGHSRGSRHSKAGEAGDDRSYHTADTTSSRLFRDGGGPGGGGGGGGGGSGDDNGSQGSRRSRSNHEPWNRPSKARSKFNEKVTWNGSRITFREYRKAIEGHLLQADAGYLIDPKFLSDYAFQKSHNAHMDQLWNTICASQE
jgi:hypothetical protein